MPDYVKIETAGNEAIADLIKQRLESAAIPCTLVSGGMSAVAGAGWCSCATVGNGNSAPWAA